VLILALRCARAQISTLSDIADITVGGVETLKRQQTAIMARPDNRPLQVQICCPTLAHEIAAGIAGARLEIIADCGHLSTLERPEAVIQAMLSWLGS